MPKGKSKATYANSKDALRALAVEIERLAAEQRASERSTRTYGKRAASLDTDTRGGRALHEVIAARDRHDEDDLDAQEQRQAETEVQREAWLQLTYDERFAMLQEKIVGPLFERRFGFPWDRRWNRLVVTPETMDTKVLQHMRRTGRHDKRRPGRRFNSRARFVLMWDRVNIMNLPKCFGLNERAPYEQARFFSVMEFTWISIMGGHRPTGIRKNATALDILHAERKHIAQVLFRVGQQPMAPDEGVEPYRGPQLRRRRQKSPPP